MKRLAILPALVCMQAVVSGGRGRRGCRGRQRAANGELPFVGDGRHVEQPTQRMERLRARYWQRRMQRLLDSVTD